VLVLLLPKSLAVVSLQLEELLEVRLAKNLQNAGDRGRVGEWGLF